jgi:hypothetical protein
VIFLVMLVVIPEIASIWQRVTFVAVVVALLFALVALHGRYIPNLVVYCGPKKPSALARVWPSILSWLIAATASLAAALVYWWLTRDVG